MRDGAGTAFLAGLLLVGVLESLGSPDHAKIGVKFAIGLVILVLVMVNMRKPSIPQGLYFGLLALTDRQHRGGGLLVARARLTNADPGPTGCRTRRIGWGRHEPHSTHRPTRPSSSTATTRSSTGSTSPSGPP